MGLRPSRRARLAIGFRILAAVAGGWGAATLLGIAIATLLPMDPADAAVTGTLAALLAIPVLAMACFRVRSAARAWGVVVASGALFALAALVGGWRP